MKLFIDLISHDNSLSIEIKPRAGLSGNRGSTPGRGKHLSIGYMIYTVRTVYKQTKNKLRGLSPQANYTDRLSDRRLSAKLVPTLADRGCHIVSVTILPQSLISVF
jgi:hypothetical protein